MDLKITETEEQIDNALAELKNHIIKACLKHRPAYSAHENHSLIREELDELWDHVKADTGGSLKARSEAMEIAVTAVRYAINICAPIKN